MWERHDLVLSLFDNANNLLGRYTVPAQTKFYPRKLEAVWKRLRTKETPSPYLIKYTAPHDVQVQKALLFTDCWMFELIGGHNLLHSPLTLKAGESVSFDFRKTTPLLTVR